MRATDQADRARGNRRQLQVPRGRGGTHGSGPLSDGGHIPGAVRRAARQGDSRVRRHTGGDEPAEDQLRQAFTRHPDARPPDRTFPPWLADTSARIRAENSAAQNSEPDFANPATQDGDGRSAVRRPRWKDPAAFVATGIGLALATTGIAMGIRYGSHTPQEPAALAMQFSGIALAATGIVLFVVPDWEVRTSRGAGLALSWNF